MNRQLFLLAALGATAALANDTPVFQKNGKPFFVIGVYDYPDYDADSYPNYGTTPTYHPGIAREKDAFALSELASAGINTVRTRMQHLGLTDLTRAEDYGVYYVPFAYNYEPEPYGPGKIDWSHFTEFHVIGSPLDQKIAEIRHADSLLFYEHQDEAAWSREACILPGVNDPRPLDPDGCVIHTQGLLLWPSYEAALNYKDFVRARDPHHLMWANEAVIPENHPRNVGLARKWRLIADMWSQDTYPVYNHNWSTNANTNYPQEPGIPFPLIDQNAIGGALDRMKATYDADGVAPFVPAAPMFFVLEAQGFNECCWDWNGMPGRGRRPEYEELRFQAYSAIIHGSRGIWWWGTDSIGSSSLLWDHIKRLASQLRDLEPALVANTIAAGPGTWSVSAAFSAQVEGTLREVNGRRYLIVANKTNQPLQGVSFQVSSWNKAHAPGGPRVLFESRTGAYTASVPSPGASWTDDFGPWGVHVYTDAPDRRPPSDLDADGKSDPAVYTQSSTANVPSHFTVLRSAVDRKVGFDLGDLTDDLPLSGDFDGDGHTDFAVYTKKVLLPNATTWGGWYAWHSSRDNKDYWDTLGEVGDVPVVGDYDGDGRTDFGVYRAPTSCQTQDDLFIYRASHNGAVTTFSLGAECDDLPVSGDFDGDGHTDFAVFKKRVDLGGGTSWGGWYTWFSSSTLQKYWTDPQGPVGALPVVADYDGDRVADMGTYKTGTCGAPSTFKYVRSTDGQFITASLGECDDEPVVGDFDGDGADDLALYKRKVLLGNNTPWGGWFTIRPSQQPTQTLYYNLGEVGDVPASPAHFR
ncbi:FG-GAP repeat domain-containing protein [Myxococcus virescens]|uniref:Uncharacterized protein n=1 Tax=Myxococcus virescens TaxID=83456 RepID=A0A511H927_9BACT|nr:VCBS repeat-containing protein [Myxococcus virescens]GEL69239.1 hypothetical protein MVI01_10230 [Myxococcus virescens]SDE34642.1 hypothetical protein SAMN04488504_10692 [Myxococcus virescens]